MNTFKAEKRDLNVKAKKIRREGYVTGSVFGKKIDGSIPLKIDAHDAEMTLRGLKLLDKVELIIEGEKKEVIIKEVQKDILKRQIIEIDFQEI